jgi:hypothetical protein
MNSKPNSPLAHSLRNASLPQATQNARFLIGAIVMFLGAGAASAQSQFEEEFDDPYKPWHEVALQLPAPPQAENLLAFYASAAATQAFEVDAKSLTVGADGVVRYTLVAISRAGARNVSYEGIRCKGFEVKLYAFGQPDGAWSRSRRNQWQKIDHQNASNRHHASLAREYFCQESTVAGSAEQILFRLRHRQSLAPHFGP